MISEIEYEDILPIWQYFLWPKRTSPIEKHSAMLFTNTYDLINLNFKPTFLGYKINNTIVGVNSGHMCKGNNYRSRGLYVFPRFRNIGIGTELLLNTIERGLEEGADFVWSYPKKEGWSTYESAGFKLASKWHNSETGINAYCRTNYLGEYWNQMRSHILSDRIK